MSRRMSLVALSGFVVCIALAFFFVYLAVQNPISVREEEGQGLQSKTVLRAWIDARPDHIHVGDIFSLTVNVLYRSNSVELDKRVLDQFVNVAPFVERGIEVFESPTNQPYVLHYRRVYHLQVIEQFPGEGYTIVVPQVPFRWRDSGLDDALKPRGGITKILVVSPRFVEKPAPLKGMIASWNAHARIAVAILAGICVLASSLLVILHLNLLVRQKKPVAELALDVRYKTLLREGDPNPRDLILRIEALCLAIAYEEKWKLTDLWKGKFPVREASTWQTLWLLIARAYQHSDPTKEDSTEAYRLAGTLVGSYKGEEKL